MSEFFAEAHVAIIPDTTRFRAQLLAELQAATRNLAVSIPVQIATGGAQAAQRLQREVATTVAATEAAVARSGRTSVTAAQNVTAAQRLQTAAAKQLAVAQTEIVGASTSASAAQIRLARAVAAETAARRAHVAALATDNAALATATRELLANATAHRTKAAAAINDARAEAIHSSQMRVAARGAAATSLSFLGIRGATLAASASFLAGAAALATFAKSIGIAASFERELAVFRETAGATADEMERVGEAAAELGADVTLPAVSAADAAQAMSELAKAGLDVEDAISGARGVLQLATAAAISNAEAVELAASALNAFGLAGDQAVRVADVLANAANEAQGSITDVGIALRQSAAVGRQVGFTLEDTVAILTTLAREGLRGSDAGTALRTALLRLVNPTEKAKGVLADLNLQIRDAQGNIRPDVFVNFGIATEKMSKQARDAAAAVIFGQDAIRAVAIASRQSITELLGVRDALQESGTAADLAAARTEGLAGAAQALRSELETIGISVGGSVTPAFTTFVLGLTDMAAAIAGSETVATAFSQTLSGIGDAFEATGVVAGLTAQALRPVGEQFGRAVTAIGVDNILAGVAAWKLFPPVFGRVNTVSQSLALKLAILAESLATARVGMLGFGAAGAAASGALLRTGSALALAASAISRFALPIGIAVAGLAFLATRASEVEKAEQALTDATEDLTAALGGLATATESLKASRSGLRTDELALAEARLAVQIANAELRQSDAARGSIERRQLQNAEAVALDNLRIAEDRLAESRDQVALAAEQAKVAAENLRAARRTEIETVIRLQQAEEDRARALQEQGRAGTGDPVSDLEAQEEVLRRVTRALEEQARASRALNTQESLDLSKRQFALAALQVELDRLATPREIRLIFETKDLEAALRKIAAETGRTGEESADAFAAGILSRQSDVIAGFNSLLERIRELFVPAMAAIGGDAKEAFMSAVAIVELPAAALRGTPSLGTRLLEAQISGDVQAELAILRQQQKAAATRAALAETDKERQEALEDQRQAQQAEQAILDSLAADAEAASRKATQDAEALARDRERRAREVREARERADRNLLEALGFARERQEIEILKAEGSAGLRDDIREQTDLIALLKQQRRTVRDRIHNQQLATQTIIALTRAIVEARAARRDLRQQEREAERERAQQRRDEFRTALELNLEIAQTTGNRSKQLQAIRALIKHWTQVFNQAVKGTNAARRARLEIARLRAQEEEILGEQKARTANFSALAFQFLQQQQGFAANLLGNLFPASAAAGTVGLPSGPAPPVSPASPIIESAQRVGGGRLGPSAGQTEAIIFVLREILDVLKRGARGQEHPEARGQRAFGSATADIM